MVTVLDRAAVSPSMERSTLASPRTLRVLVMEQHRIWREGLSALLQHEGLAIAGSAATVQEAEDLAIRTQPDVLLLGLPLAGAPSRDAVERVKGAAYGIPLVILASGADPGEAAAAIAAGAAGYLLRQSDPATIPAALQLACAGGFAIDPSLLPHLMGPMNHRSRHAEAAILDRLSARELAVLRGIVDGKSNAQIATEIHYSVATVKNVVHGITDKLGVGDRAQAGIFAVRAGLPSLSSDEAAPAPVAAGQAGRDASLRSA